MYCIKCNRHIAYCKCTDINERLKGIGNNEITKELALSGMEQRAENKINIRPEIEFLLDNLGNRVKVTFESKRYNGIFYLIGKVFDVSPSTTRFMSEESDYPEGVFDYLNTSRIRSAELAQ